MSACWHHRPLLLLLWEGFFALFQEDILINFIEWSTVQLPSLSAWQLCPFFKKQAESRAKAWLQLAQRLQQAAVPLGWVKELETCAWHKLELTVLLFIQTHSSSGWIPGSLPHHHVGKKRAPLLTGWATAFYQNYLWDKPKWCLLCLWVLKVWASPEGYCWHAAPPSGWLLPPTRLGNIFSKQPLIQLLFIQALISCWHSEIWVMSQPAFDGNNCWAGSCQHLL